MKIKAIIRMCVWWFIETAISIRDAKNTIYKFFPVCGGKNYFFSSLSFSKDYYFSKYYMEKNNNPLYISYASFKAEILKGEFVTKGASYKVDIKEPSIIPVSIDERRTLPINPKNGVTISFDKKNLELRNWKDNRFYHLRIENPKTVEITSEKNLIVGAPLALTQKKRMPKKLVMMIFVDSLCWELFRENNLSKELPYLYSFFKKGMVFDECYSWGNWTLTSAANIVTGLTTPNHKLFHPRRNDTLLDDIPIISEYFQRAGYLTFQSCGNWRKTPAYGYVRGYDRTIFKGEMGIEETIYPLLDHLRAFPERDHFMWMSLNDAHHTLRTTQDLSVQSHINLESQDLLDEIDKTFHKTDFIGKKKERIWKNLEKLTFI